MKLFTIFCLLSLHHFNINGFVIDYTKDPNEEKTVVLLAFSGLESDVLFKHSMPALQKFVKDGVLATGKRQAFQTETLPALHTLVTGRHPERHGMLSNKMKDISNMKSFDVSNRDEKWWNEVEPIWVTNEKRNGTKSALCFWPGYNVVFSGVKATYTCATEKNGTRLKDPFKEIVLNSAVNQPVMSMEDRIAKVMEWLSLAEPPKFIAVYFEEPFTSALAHGVASKETAAAIRRINSLLEKLQDELAAFKLLEKINIIVTSDASPIDMIDNQKIYLEDYLDDTLKKSYDVIDDGPIMTVLPKEMANVGNLFTNWNGSHEHMKVYTKDMLPERYHFTNANRTMPLTLVADKGWRILARRINDPNDKRKAAIGYSADNVDTQTLLIAHGPAFRKGVRLDKIDSVDIYEILCSALRLQPNDHDGSGYVLTNVIAKQDKWYWHFAKTVIQSKEGLTGIIILFIVLLFAALYLVIHAMYKASSRCRCCNEHEANDKKKQKSQPYEYKGTMNEGKMHLLGNDEDDLSASELDEDSEVNCYEVKYSRP